MPGESNRRVIFTMMPSAQQVYVYLSKHWIELKERGREWPKRSMKMTLTAIASLTPLVCLRAIFIRVFRYALFLLNPMYD